MVTGRRESQPRRRWRGKRERLRGEEGARAADLCDRVVDLVLIRRSAAPRRGVQSSPEQELLGAMTSLGPSRECYKPSRKSSGRPAKTAGARPRPRLCLLKGCEQRFRHDGRCSAIAASRAGRRRGPGRGGRRGELPDHGGRQTEARRAEPALPGARQEPKTTSRRSRSRGREGNH